MNHFDIVLLYTFNRYHGYYLNIVKNLGKTHRVGLLVDPTKVKNRSKHEITDARYLEELQQFGAKIATESITCNILFVPVIHYYEENFPWLNTIVSSYKMILGYVVCSPMASHLEILKEKLPLHQLLVEDIKLLKSRLSTEKKDHLLDGIDVKGVSFVYTQYPVLRKIEMDYLIVFPTKMSFQKADQPIDAVQKKRFMRNINKLLSKISPEDTVYYKLHSVLDGGWPFAHSKMEAIEKNLPQFMIQSITNIINHLKLDDQSSQIAEIANTSEFVLMTRSCQNLSTLTKSHNYPVELFYPHVRKGVISGRSNSIWGALKANLPVYNCDDNVIGSGYGDYAHLKENYEHFGVDPCHGELSFDPFHFDKVQQKNNVDLIKYLKEMIGKNPS